MSVLFLIITIVLLFGMGCGAAIWFVLRRQPAVNVKKTAPQATGVTTLTYRWRYIVLPITILLLSIILVVVFSGQLDDEVAYRFKSDGSPDGWIGRNAIILWTLLPQLLLTLLAGGITWGIAKLGARINQNMASGIKLERILLLMGNMVTLPQIIICFALFDIFSYNSYQVHIMPVWVFALIIMVLGALVLSVFFIQAIRQVLGTYR